MIEAGISFETPRPTVETMGGISWDAHESLCRGLATVGLATSFDDLRYPSDGKVWGAYVPYTWTSHQP